MSTLIEHNRLWYAPDSGDVYAIGVGDTQIATGLTREHARRVVACVNACIGIPTAQLEAMNAQQIDLLAHAYDVQAREALAEYDALRAGPKEVPVPRPPPAPDVLVMGATKAMSYGPRVEPYDDGIVVPAKSAEDAEFWAVYEWRTSKYVLEGGWWEWIADCDTEEVARKIAEALARET